MFLSFVTAILLIAVQWRGVSSDSTPGTTAALSTASFVDTPTEPQQLNLSHTATPLYPTQANAKAIAEQRMLIVDLSDRQVYVYQDGKVRANYEIAVGRSGWETPTGKFSIIRMQHNPVWRHPFTKELVPAGPDNPLGSRWIGFWTDGQHQIGFHGTNQENLIGQAVSHGCIRMRESDIHALYEQVAVGTPVIVRP
jgi:lipoprotein-anchoring transpeptidase ErfK/SrfK